MKWRALLAAAFSVSTAALAHAQPAGGVARGSEIYVICGACHGSVAQGEQTLMAPSLAGQRTAYMLRQLRNFRDGTRPSGPDDIAKQMPQILLTISSETDWNSVAQFLEQIQPQHRPQASGTDLQLGQRKYVICANCHGNEGEGNDQLASPRLNMLPSWYVAEQLQKFKDGRRGAGVGDSPGNGMRAIARTLTPGEVAALAQYIPTMTEAKVQ